LLNHLARPRPGPPGPHHRTQGWRKFSTAPPDRRLPGKTGLTIEAWW